MEVPPMIDFTTVVAVDDEHLDELRLVWPTWRRNRPQIMAQPLLLICDGCRPLAEWKTRLSFVDHRDQRLVAWNAAGLDQRAKMLNGLVHGPATFVTTPWYLKLDTDAVAVWPDEWICDEWFLADEAGHTPVFVASPWGYSKPSDVIQRLDDWADSIPDLNPHARLNIPPGQEAGRVWHPRIISWCFFGDTAWTRRMWALCEGRLPVPSQDTFLWYCAARSGQFFRRVSMKALGWQHAGHRRSLIQWCEQAMNAPRRQTSSDSNVRQ
jgi:hypothetical protein